MDIVGQVFGGDRCADVDVHGTDALVGDHNLEPFDFLDIPASLPPTLRERLAAINECAATRHSSVNTALSTIHPAPPKKSPEIEPVASQWSDLKDWLDYTWDDWPDGGHINDVPPPKAVQLEQKASLCHPSTPSLWAGLPFDFDSPDTLSPPNISLSGSASTPNTSYVGCEPAHGSTYTIVESERQGDSSGAFHKLHDITKTAEEAQRPVSYHSHSPSSTSPPVVIDRPHNTAVLKKRDSSAVQDSDCEAPDPQQARLRRRLDHTKVEQRYRAKLKDGIRELGECIPALQNGVGSDGPSDETHEANPRAPAPNPSKGLILTKAKEYIRDLEQKVQILEQETSIMRGQIRQLTQAASPELSQDGARAASRGRHLSKLMLACLAGIMTTEAAFTGQQGSDIPDGRGLFAVPMPLLEGFSRSLYRLGLIKHASSSDAFLLVMKAVLLFGLVGCIIQVSLFATEQKTVPRPLQQFDKRGRGCAAAGPQALRRLAFQTAVQTIKVPDGLLRGLAAAIFSLCKLGINRVVFGRVALSSHADTSGDTGAARIKACDVLLDAQLAGGDSQVTNTRLLVTLVASVSLPETPYRRMMMALHIHLLAWGLARVLPFCQLSIRQFARLLAGSQWNKARALEGQRLQLPEHLHHLLSREPEEVFTDKMMQLLEDLVWQSLSTFSSAGMVCSVPGDPFIQSPIDALAALSAITSVHQLLMSYLEAGGEGGLGQAGIANDLRSATDIAPPDSVALAYGLVARAVLVDNNPSSHIGNAIRAVDALPAHLGFENGMQAQSAFHAEFILPLQCAVAIALSHHRDFTKARSSLLRCLSHPMRDLRLLGFLSLYRCLEVIFKHRTVAVRCTELLEQMAGLLRRWTTCDNAGAIGLGPGAEEVAADLCVRVFEWRAGTRHVDEGYITT